MPNRTLQKHERETIISFGADDETANVFTYERSWISHFKHVGLNPDSINGYGGHSYNMPAAWVRKPLPPRGSRRE